MLRADEKAIFRAASCTIVGLEHQWGQRHELLSDKSVLVIDEAGMIGTRQMERVLAYSRSSMR